MTLTVWTGEEERASAFSFTSDGGPEIPAQAALMPGGAYSVASFPTKQRVIGHRCGSGDWAEGSPLGATQSALRGVDALELPLSRALTGEWFPLHDQTLLRTSGVDLDPSTLTWAQIQEYLNASPPGGDPNYGAQPYALASDILAAYARSHVTFVDPKYHAGPEWHDDMYSMIEAAVPNARQHVVIKFSGDGPTVADAATARGYTSWGYFYDSWFQANPSLVLAQAARWAWIGMEWNAPQATWDALAALGKPMIGFIVATPEQRDEAIAKGATAVMCSGVRAILGAPVI